MTSPREKEGSMLVKELANRLKALIEQPEWSKYIKTGCSKERPPFQKDWWFMRAGSILRRVYMNGPVGVSKLRTYYGGRKNLGHQPSHFKKASGKIIRTILQQLETLGFVKKDKKGRKITSKGEKFITDATKEV